MNGPEFPVAELRFGFFLFVCLANVASANQKREKEFFFDRREKVYLVLLGFT